MSDQEKHKHDYRQGTDPGIRLVVRAGNTYGSALAGEEILVDVSELRNPSTMSACAPREDLDRVAAEKAAEKAAQAAKAKPSERLGQ